MTGLNDHAEVFYLVGSELALFEFQVEIKFSHTLQDALHTFFMEGGVRGVDEEIIHIDDEPSFGNHIVEGVVHKSLKSGRGIGEPKEHDGGFKESFVDDEGCFPLVTILDSYVVVPPPNVKLGEDLGIS